jgi:hypothetical protein
VRCVEQIIKGFVKGKDILLLSYVIAIGYLRVSGMSACMKLPIVIAIGYVCLNGMPACLKLHICYCFHSLVVHASRNHHAI